MATNSLVSKLRSISNKILDDHESVSLIMLLGNNLMEYTTAFDFVISAKWLDNYDQDEGVDIILDYLFDNLSQEELLGISRVTIIHTGDYIIRNITENMRHRGGISYNMDCRFGEIIIPYAIIFESRYEN